MVVALLACLVACKGPQGDVGPQGPAGPQGTQGTQGPAGPAGTANLMASAWVTVPDSVWIGNNDSTYYVISREDANITQAVLDRGLVMAYYRNAGRDNVVFSLPTANEEMSLGYFMRVNGGRGTINFDLTFFQPRRNPIDFDLEFRWIVIPPNATTGRLKSLDWKDYEAVRRELGLVD